MPNPYTRRKWGSEARHEDTFSSPFIFATKVVLPMIRGGPATPREVWFSFDDMDATWHPNG